MCSRGPIRSGDVTERHSSMMMAGVDTGHLAYTKVADTLQVVGESNVLPTATHCSFMAGVLCSGKELPMFLKI